MKKNSHNVKLEKEKNLTQSDAHRKSAKQNTPAVMHWCVLPGFVYPNYTATVFRDILGVCKNSHSTTLFYEVAPLVLPSKGKTVFVHHNKLLGITPHFGGYGSARNAALRIGTEMGTRQIQKFGQ